MYYHVNCYSRGTTENESPVPLVATCDAATLDVGGNTDMDETTTSAKLLLRDDESAKDVNLTVVREENGKVSPSTEDCVLILDAKTLRKLLAFS
jgi:hypothetical protein